MQQDLLLFSRYRSNYLRNQPKFSIPPRSRIAILVVDKAEPKALNLLNQSAISALVAYLQWRSLMTRRIRLNSEMTTAKYWNTFTTLLNGGEEWIVQCTLIIEWNYLREIVRWLVNAAVGVHECRWLWFLSRFGCLRLSLLPLDITLLKLGLNRLLWLHF